MEQTKLLQFKFLKRKGEFGSLVRKRLIREAHNWSTSTHLLCKLHMQQFPVITVHMRI